jgi:hypothetical protein
MKLERFGFGKKQPMPEFEKVKAEIKAEKDAPMIALAQELPFIRSAVTESFIDMDTGKVNKGEGFSSAININDVWDSMKDVKFTESNYNGLPGVLERLAAKGITRSTNDLVKQLDNLNNAKQELSVFKETTTPDDSGYFTKRDELKTKVSDLTKELQKNLPNWELLLTGAV